MKEFDLLARIRRRVALSGAADDVILGIGDDAALLQVPSGHELVVSTDTLNLGVHFPDDSSPADIGWKSLAVNLSDLAAMGAKPRWVMLSLSLPSADEDWIESFLDGFLELAEQHAVSLVGGDTTRGPLSISVTAMGVVETGKALRRDAARVGDDIWVSGSLGDAAAALRQWQSKGLQSAKLRYRLDRPTPRVEFAGAIAAYAHAAIDLSDGLLADLGHVLVASGVGADIDACRLPTSRTLNDHFPDDAQRWSLQLGGGDDYELCFTASPADAWAIEQALAAQEVPATVIGRISAEQGLRISDTEGASFVPTLSGFEHFASSADPTPSKETH